MQHTTSRLGIFALLCGLGLMNGCAACDVEGSDDGNEGSGDSGDGEGGEGSTEGDVDTDCDPADDADSDGICDADEMTLGTDPNNADSDGDNLSDSDEIELGTDPLNADTDGDFIPDGDEVLIGTDPTIIDEACAGETAQAELGVARPVDIIIAIDTSGSMEGEINAVQANINNNFADIIGASGVDYRVIMVANYAADNDRFKVCISAPLSGDDCMDPWPAVPANTERFRHYDTYVDSHNALELLVDTYSQTDRNNLAVGGWSSWLRPNSTKTFLLISDDDPSISDEDFDNDLLALGADIFGTASERNYRFHSIIGMAARQDNPDSAWTADQPVQNEQCSPGSESAAPDYQRLSILTGGLRFPLCNNDSFDVVFQAMAEDVIDQVQLPCSFEAVAPGGQVPDFTRVSVAFTPSTTSTPVPLNRATDLAACVADSFYVDGSDITLCPDTCTMVRADPTGRLDMNFACDEAPTPCEESIDCPAQACIDGFCGPCQETADCAQGLTCLANGACGQING